MVQASSSFSRASHDDNPGACRHSVTAMNRRLPAPLLPAALLCAVLASYWLAQTLIAGSLPAPRGAARG
jgi:hypothetical protein